MLNVRIGGTLESSKERPELVACKHDIAIEGTANQCELAAIAKIISEGLKELLPELIKVLGTDGVAKFALTMNEPLIEWSKSILNQ